MEKAQILPIAHEPRFADKPAARIVPARADEGVYRASESSFYRVLREHGQNPHRGRAKAPAKFRPPSTHMATTARQLWSWDMTYLASKVNGVWFYMYLIVDVFSRKIVGFEVHDTDDANHAAHLAKRTAWAEGIHARPNKPVWHGDNGSTFKATTVLAMLYGLGIQPSYSRPRVSDDNAYVESLFRTAKYRPEFPAKGFESLDAARIRASPFVHWYNNEHRHSGIRYVTPAQRHEGLDQQILDKRHALYLKARETNPRRWSRHTRDWSRIHVVKLNPDRDETATGVGSKGNIQIKAA